MLDTFGTIKMSSINLSLNDVDDINIEIVSSNKVIGTVHIQKQGIGFTKPGNSMVDHYTNWDKLPILLNGRPPDVL